MIDLHCHILPGVDDGAQNIQQSIKMAARAAKEGIHTIVATPHHKNGRYENSADLIRDKVDELNAELSSYELNMHILPGQEVRLYGDILEDYEKGQLLTIADQNKHLFIELPSDQVPRYTEQLLFDIQVKGINPIIVHPERNRELVENPDKLYKMVKSGAYTQVTAASLVGQFGKKLQKFSQKLIEHNLTHFIGSDAHNTTNRSFFMKEAYDLIEKEFNLDTVDLFLDNATKLVNGDNIYKDIPERMKTKRFFGLF